MTLDQLIAFDAIVSTGTFRAAADRLNKAQSAVSHQVRKLETEVGFDLFTRDTYRPSLTHEGEVFFRETVRVLDQVRGLKNVAKGLQNTQEATINIAMTATMSLEPFLSILGEIGQAFPGTHIRVASEMMGGPLERLMRGDADLTLAGLEGVPINEVETLPFGAISIRPVARSDFLASQSRAARTRQEMQTYTQVIVSGTGGQDFDQNRDLLSGGQRWAVSTFEAKKSIILAGLGWGGMPEHLIKKELERGELVPLTVEGFPLRHTEIFAIRRRDQPMGRVMSSLWAAIGKAEQSS